MAGVAAFLSVFVPSLAVAAGVLTAFSVLRRKPRFRRFFAPRQLLYEVDDGLVAPPELGAGLFAWLKVLRFTDEEVIATAGLDAYVFLKFLRMAVHLFSFIGVFCCAVLIPVYATGHNDAGDVEVLTLSNIENESDRLWAPVIMTWMVTVVVWFFLWKAYDEVTRVCKHNQYLSGAHSFSVAVFDIPPDCRDEGCVRDFFEQFFPGEVQTTVVARTSNKLSDLVDDYKDSMKKLRHSEAEHSLTGDRPRHIPITAPQGGKVDSIDYFMQESEKLKEEVAKCRRLESVAAEAGFVSFTKPICAAKAAQLWYDRKGWIVAEAPEPRDVYWPNMFMTEKLKSSRETVTTAATAALIFLWAIPVTFISTLTTLDNLEKWVPFIKSIVDLSEALKTFLTGFLPTLALIAFMALLPSVLLFFSKMEGLYSWSLLQRAVLKKMYYFQVVNVFFVTALSGAVLNSIGDIVDSPTSTFRLLGDSIPKVSTFFTSYVVMQGLGGYPLELLRVGPLILGAVWARRGALTHQERCECDDPGYGSGYGLWFSPPLLIFTIVLIYSVIAPFILPFAVAYFVLALATHSYNVMYVYRSRYQSNGRLWPLVFSRAVAGLVIMQITMIGVMSLKYAKIQGPFLIPLPILTLFYFRELHGRYRRAASETPLVALLRPDGEKPREPEFLDGAYVRPCLKPENDDVSVDKKYFPEATEAVEAELVADTPTAGKAAAREPPSPTESEPILDDGYKNP